MNLSTTSAVWVKFFKDAGVPSEMCAKYAVMFTDHRIQKDMLSDLDRDILSDIGVDAVGDKMAILKQAKFVAEQAKRDKSSKLLADGIKTLESRSNGRSSPASRMITHTINSRDTSGRNSPSGPKSSSSVEDSQRKTVFERLGQDSPTSSKNSGVFRRLGQAKDTELPYAGVLKKSSPPQKKNVLVLKKAKSTSVLERLGEIKSPQTSDNAKIQKTVANNKIKIRKSALFTKKFKATAIGKEASEQKPEKVKRNSTVHERLGPVVSSTTPQTIIPDSNKLAVRKVGIKRKLLIVKPAQDKAVKRKSTGDIVVVPKKQPISSNKVSSTSSAGLFKGAAKKSSDVFSRLGKSYF